MPPFSIYIHIPFCRHRCGYCDFNTYAGVEDLIPAYVKALCREILAVSAHSPSPAAVHTIYFGGGTPSLLTPAQIGEILTAIRKRFDLAAGAEISMEANPGTLSRSNLDNYRKAGVNRLSLGVQSANTSELRLLDRIHNIQDVTEAVSWARQAGFDNLNLDFIFGLPGQTMASWRDSLAFGIGLGVEHLSLYNLTIEDGTPLKTLVTIGKIPRPDDDLAADMYEYAMEALEGAGFLHYEISNWAKKRGDTWLMCRHNLQYWRNQPYFGFGAGAHGYVDHTRTANLRGIREYIHAVLNGKVCFPAGPAVETVVALSQKDEQQETLMVGLRLLREGVSRIGFKERFGEPIESVFGRQIQELIRLGLLEGGETLRLTRRGCLLGNQVFMRFVGE